MPDEQVTLLEHVGLPALAGGLAVILSHPMELTKTRIQLDNERSQSRNIPRRYAGVTDVSSFL